MKGVRIFFDKGRVYISRGQGLTYAHWTTIAAQSALIAAMLGTLAWWLRRT